MGSSDYASIPLELALARKGLPVWRLQASRLLETPQLITGRTLLWATSQSGRSGEIVALLAALPKANRPTVVAVTNDPESPLAAGGDLVIGLHSGSEATVSTKSYLNTLAVMFRAAALFAGRGEQAAIDEIVEAAKSLRTRLGEPVDAIRSIAQRAVTRPNPRFALIAGGVDSTSALTGALIMKEAARVAAEGYVGGAFRHGPLELAGESLTAVLLGGSSSSSETLTRLAGDLARTGSLVVAIAPANLSGAEHIPVPQPDFSRLVHTMYSLQMLSVELAKASGLVPGEFRFGQKITATL
jgi:glucosamine--fructose-6-phosphate aminotransferase (isomerizing)